MDKDLSSRLRERAEAESCRRTKTMLVAHATILAAIEALRSDVRPRPCAR